jgi:predicted permease
MVEVANILLPIFAVIGLGAALRHGGFAPPQAFQQTNRLVYWIGIPAYLFYKTAESKLEGDAAIRVFAVLAGAMVLTIALSYLIAGLLRLPAPSTGSFVHGAFRSNLVYVGLPVVFLALAARGYEQLSELQAVAVISIALLVPVYNIAAVLVLVGGHEGGREQLPRRLREMVKQLVTNPLILSCAAGLIVLGMGWKLPEPLRQTCKTLGDMTTPLALLGIGAALTFTALRGYWLRATLSAGLKVIAAPLAGLLLARWMRLSPAELRIALIFLACPSATVTYIMAQQMGADDGLAANIVVLSTVLAAPALAAALVLT